MARRYGKVTVTGWIEEAADDVVFSVWTEASGYDRWLGDAVRAYAVVEFLPEPVVFKDGDVVRYGNNWTYLRSGGRWVYVGPMDPSRVSTSTGTDEDLARDLMDGACVRLVPEGATDAG